jgi:catechol 2,3-dioxygenase-like lactoylglutathione lyase family enzyme
MAKVIGLGHVGVYCRDLAKMESFYRDVLGLQVTKKRPGSMVFLSSDPQRSDHEIALMTGRPDGDDFNPIQQISLGVDSLESVREFHKRIRSAGYQIEHVVSHCSAIGCYYFDPEGNHCEGLLAHAPRLLGTNVVTSGPRHDVGCGHHGTGGKAIRPIRPRASWRRVSTGGSRHACLNDRPRRIGVDSKRRGSQ